MKYRRLIIACGGALLCLPLITSANVQIITTGSGSINNTTSASAVSGGQHGSEEISSISVQAHATTTSNTNGGGSTVQAEVSVEAGGTTYTESIKKEIQEGETVEISTEYSSSSDMEEAGGGTSATSKESSGFFEKLWGALWSFSWFW